MKRREGDKGRGDGKGQRRGEGKGGGDLLRYFTEYFPYLKNHCLYGFGKMEGLNCKHINIIRKLSSVCKMIQIQKGNIQDES